MSVNVEELPGDRRCLDDGNGKPSCEPQDIVQPCALLVDEPQHVTCATCLWLRVLRAPGGPS